MLSTLHIKNIGIIDDLSIDFNEVLNILTGETGAGKTLIIFGKQTTTKYCDTRRVPTQELQAHERHKKRARQESRALFIIINIWTTGPNQGSG